MSRILVVFGTTEGQTGTIAHRLGAQLRLGNHHVDVVNAAEAQPNPAPYDAVIVAASVHAGGYQRDVGRWVRTYAGLLNARPTAFVSVCLGILQPEPSVHEELHKIMSDFLFSTGWRPVETKMVAGALMYTRYNVLKRWIMKGIARKAGGATDTKRDYEYTDWLDLHRFADQFSARLSAASAPLPRVPWAPRASGA